MTIRYHARLLMRPKRTCDVSVYPFSEDTTMPKRVRSCLSTEFDLTCFVSTRRPSLFLCGRVSSKGMYDAAVDIRIRLEPAMEVARCFPEPSTSGEFAPAEVTRAAASLKSLAAALDASADLLMGEPGKDVDLGRDSRDVDDDATVAESAPKIGPESWRQGILDSWALRVQSMPGAFRTNANTKISFKVVDNRPSAQIRTILQGGKHLERCHRIKGVVTHLESGKELTVSDSRHYDDGELYRSLLREVIESGNATGGSLRYAQLSRSGRVRKTVDRRASKGRKLRYVVHETLVGFLAPIPLPDPGPVDAIVSALFGGVQASID
jgi:protein AATF/BFR2